MRLHWCKHHQLPALPSTSSTVVIVAHPDDESFGFGGLIQHCSRSGCDLITLTRGEKGLGEVTRRVEELRGSALKLGIRDLFLFDLPDGDLISHRKTIQDITKQVLLSSYTTIATMHPSSTFHPDHIVISKFFLKFCANKRILLQYLPHKFVPVTNQDHLFEVTLTPEQLETKREAIMAHQTQIVDIQRILPNLLGKEYYYVV